MGKRPRINAPIKDDLSFEVNKASQKARQIITIEEELTYDLWYDKHYLDRIQHGDDNGKREGINTETIQELIKKSLKHLVYYGIRVKGFCFLNHENDSRTRIVLQDSSNDKILNVVIEVHFLTVKSFEITVKTAMCVDDFKIEAGQYIVDFFDTDGSSLKKKEQNKIIEVFNLQF